MGELVISLTKPGPTWELKHQMLGFIKLKMGFKQLWKFSGRTPYVDHKNG
jgi:hypothetical protein